MSAGRAREGTQVIAAALPVVGPFMVARFRILVSKCSASDAVVAPRNNRATLGLHRDLGVAYLSASSASALASRDNPGGQAGLRPDRS